jgi:hypothetical protein
VKTVRLAAFVAIVLIAFGQQAPPAEPPWPRAFSSANGKLTLYQPQADSWTNGLELHGRAALSVVPKGEKEPVFGAMSFAAKTQADKTARTIYIYDITVEASTFPSVKDEAKKLKLQAMVTELAPRSPVTISLERLVAMMEGTGAEQKSIKVSLDPPPIFFSQRPAILIMIDGKPLMKDIEGTGLQFVVNTNWDLFYVPAASTYYLLNGQVWLTAKKLEDQWSAVQKLPADFSKIPDQPNFKDVRAQIPAKSPSAEAAPQVFFSEKPAELIVVSGAPRTERVGKLPLVYIANTESDLFFHEADRFFYFLTSGRWFRAPSLSGPWTSAVADLPNEFAQIPPEHEKSRVLVSVKGTRQAEQAVLEASVPQTATLDRKAAAAAVQVQYDGAPNFKEIPGTGVSYATNTPADVFLIGSTYYVCYEGAWFYSMVATGPWTMSDSVPKQMAQIPPESPKHHVTYVETYASTPTTVTVGYYPGYYGTYVSYGSVYFGTGYYYPPYYWYGYGYPIYYPPRYYAYGCSAWYNPHTGTYARGASVYGPYGGYGRAAAYNPRTGAYARGEAAWGPGGSAWRAGGYNPTTGTGAIARGGYNAWTDTAAGGYRASNGYANWGGGAVVQGDDWAKGRYYSDSRGTIVGGSTSEGGKILAGSGSGPGGSSGFIAKDQDNNIYAGKDGNVYKRDSDGNWYQNSGSGEWESTDKPTRPESGSNRQSQASASQTGARTSEPGVPRQSTTAGSTAAGAASAESRLGQTRQPGLPSTTNVPGNMSYSDAMSSRSSSAGYNRSLESEARSRSYGAQQTQQRSTWQSRNPSRGSARGSGGYGGNYSRGTMSRASYGGGMRGGGRRR